jgi:chromosome segregation ATPase
MPSRQAQLYQEDDDYPTPVQKQESDTATEDTDSSSAQQLSVIEQEKPTAVRADTADLQRKLRSLEQENRSLFQSNRENMSELADLKTESVDYNQISRKLSACEHEIDELSQVIKSKDASINALEQAYTKLENDYKKLLGLRTRDSELLSAKQIEISRLTREIESLRTNARFDDEPPRTHIRSVAEEQPVWPKSQASVVPSAMKDNVHFGDSYSEARPTTNIPVTQMNDSELRLRLQTLTKEKEEKERFLNRAPPKGANLAHVRRQKAELDDQVVELDALLSKVRLEMKRRQIY